MNNRNNAPVFLSKKDRIAVYCSGVYIILLALGGDWLTGIVLGVPLLLYRSYRAFTVTSLANQVMTLS